MSTAALEHLRNWRGQKPLLREKHRQKGTEKLYVDRVFVCKTCTVKDLSQLWQWLNGLANRLTTQGVKTEILIYNLGPSWTVEGGEGGSLPLVSDPALCDNHDFDSQPISKKKKKVPKIWPLQIPPLPHPHTHSCQLRLLCKTQGRDEWTHPTVTIQPHKHWELWMSETNLQLSINVKMTGWTFPCNGEDCMQPKIH